MDILGVGSNSNFMRPSFVTSSDLESVLEITEMPLSVVTVSLKTALYSGSSLQGNTVLAFAGSRSVTSM